MVYADVQDRNEAASVRKSSGAFSQLQQSLEIKVDKQRDGEYRRLSAEARPFCPSEKVKPFQWRETEKVNLIEDWGAPLQ